MAKKRRPAKKAKPKKVRASKRRINLVFRNMIIFIVLFLISFLIKNMSGNDTISQIFLLLSILFGAAAIAFLISLFVFLFMKWIKK